MTEIGTCRISLLGWNPRKNFEPEAMEELKKSIQEHGILEPLIVRMNKVHPEAGYELVAGERRLKAAQELGLNFVPIVVKELSDRQVREIMLIENLQRSQLEPLEEAAALQVLLEDAENPISQEELGKKLGKSQSWIANRLRLLKAPDELKEMIISRQITAKHVMALLPVAKYPIFKNIILPEIKKKNQFGQISVKDVEDVVRSKVVYDFDAGNVLCFDDFSYDLREYKTFFDFSKCKGCNHIILFLTNANPENKEKKRYCLEQKCWKEKINQAKKKYDAAMAEKMRKLTAKDVVDITKINWDSYKNLSNVGWDASECIGCENCKPEKHNPEKMICLDVACANKKERAHNREKNQAAKKETAQTFVEMDAWISKFGFLSNAEIRGILKLLVQHLWGDSIKPALKPWASNVGKRDITEVDKIPNEDLVKALLRLCIVQDMTAHNYSGVNRKALEKTIAIFEGRPIPKERWKKTDCVRG